MAKTTEKANDVGRKKREIPSRAVKLDGDLVTRAKDMAHAIGLDTGAYLSEMLRPLIDREWVKYQRKLHGGQEK